MKLVTSGWNVNPRIASAPPAPFAPPASQATTPGVPPDLMAWARGIIEKIKTSNVRWVPWLDDLTEETETHRSHYRPMLREPVIKAAFKKKVLAVAALDVQVQPADPDNPRDREAAEFALFALSQIAGQTRKIAWNTLGHAIVDGCSVCEPVWDMRPVRVGRWAGKKVWRAYKAKDTKNLRINTDLYKNPVSIDGLGPNSGQSWRPQDFVIWTHDQFFENIQGLSDFRAAYRDFWLKQQSLEFRSLHLERFSLPYLKGTYTSNEQKAALEAALEEARGGTWVTAPVGTVIEAIDMGLRGTADYQSAVDNCDRGMLLAINGSYLTILEGQVADGRGDTSIHKETSELQEWMLAAEMGDMVTRQMLPALYEANYPDVAPGTATWGAINESAIGQWIDNNLKLQQAGVPLSKREAYRYCGRQEPADQADTLVPPALAAAPPALPFGEMPEPEPRYIDAAVKQLLGSRP